jgi:hypothetical protein
MKSINLPLVLLFLVSMPFAAWAQEPPEATPTSWVNPQGKVIEAEFVRLQDTGVVLRLKSNGKEASVPFSALSLESHLIALKLGEPEAFSKPLLKAPERVVVEDFVPSMTMSANELLTSPFGSATTLEQFLDTAIAELERGNSFVVWHALPPRMQNDIEDLLVNSMAALGKGPIVQLRSIMKSVNTVIHDKSNFILAHPALASQPEVVASLQKQWPMIAGISSKICDQSKWQSENFTKGKMIPWLAEMVADVGPYAIAMKEENGEAQGSKTKFTYKILSQSADRAKVEFTVTGLPEGQQIPPLEVDLQKVGNIWLAPTYMNQLRQGLDQALQQVAANSSGVSMVATGLLGTAAAGIGSIERAQTQEEFEAAIEELSALMPMPGGPMQ